ncbi:hypothetical protein LOTGIDRAFT_171196 [Lottia gigantea]|uniref:C-type lectin domain-containing protein n=1 Tax=Lottia gigantea TaxID=225164 RepID=V4CMS2_LOTGI|nr:hypothetical protein LOTGIDRAFT_171196 [Lottia gigantea]ESP03665.1 hypothetical protein LOTGIDRAFT_171196 [Lottia gigantea]
MDFGIVYHLIYLLAFTSASCPSGSKFYQARGLCFKLFTVSKNYTEADIACKDKGGILARIKDGAIQNFTEDKYAGKYFWIGLEDDDNDGVYMWADNSSAMYNNWQTTPPSGRCARYTKSGLWIAELCSEILWFLCELPKGPNKWNFLPSINNHRSH